MKKLKIRQVKSLKQLHQITLCSYRFSILFLSVFVCYLAQAQFAGWPTSGGAEIDASPYTVSTTQYLDDNRARITSVTQVTAVEYDLQLAPPSGGSLATLSFPTDKWCLAIQMEDHTNIGSGNKVGQHTRLVVNSYSSGTGILNVTVPPSNSMPNFELSTTSRVQIIRVPVYGSLTLNPSGVLTCREYNAVDGTGGVAAVVAVDVTFNGGIINASAKGYMYSWSGSPALGAGGPGILAPGPTAPLMGLGQQGGPAAGALAPILNGGAAPDCILPGCAPSNTLYGYLCTSDPSANNTFDFNWNYGIPGEDGFGADNVIGSGTSTDFSQMENHYPSFPNSSSVWHTIRMGNSGNPGTAAGGGGGGGGFGGKSFANTIQPGNLGYQGADGGTGGDVGNGGRGGGIILLKTSTVNTIATNFSNRTFLFAQGQNGENGEHGENGGDGGNGGEGALGDCFSPTQIAPATGTGGYGQSGVGASGGDGGNGGHSGTIWVMKQNTTVSLANHYNLNGGKGGGGGTGGYSREILTLPLNNKYNSPSGKIDDLICNTKGYTYCPPTIPCIPIDICDCDKVFDHLANAITDYSVSTAAGNVMPYTFTPTVNTSEPSVIFEVVNGANDLNYTTTPVNGDCAYRYHCVMANKAEYKRMLDKAARVIPLETYTPSAGTNLNVGTNQAIQPLLGAPIDLQYYDAGYGTTTDVLEYTPSIQYPDGYGRLKDKDNPMEPVVVEGNCLYNYRVAGGGLHYPPTGDGGGCHGCEGEGGEGDPPSVEVKATVIIRDKKTGQDGTTGGDAPNPTGDAFADGNVPPPPMIEQDGNNGTFVEYTDLVSVVQANGSELKTLELKNTDKTATFIVYTTSGQVLDRGSFEGIKVLNYATGVYLILIEQGAQLDYRKIFVD